MVIHATTAWVTGAVGHADFMPAVDLLSVYLLRDPMIGGLTLEISPFCKSGEPQNPTQLLAHGTFLAARIFRAKAAEVLRPTEGLTIFGPETKARVFLFIETHLTQEISIPALAHEARLSVSHFSSVFKATTGLTPEQYLLRSRLVLARRLICTGTRTIGEIAHATGFADHSHLTVQFKRMFGSPPKTFYPAVRQL